MTKVYAIIEKDVDIKFNFVLIGRIGESGLYQLSGTESKITRLAGPGILRIANTDKQINRINKFLAIHEIDPVPENLSNSELVKYLGTVFAPGKDLRSFYIADVAEDEK